MWDEMWANPFEITNVVSMKLLIEKYWVIFDSINCVGVFKVETTNGTVEVLLNNNRLYYLDLAHGDNAEVMFITMVGKNYEGFSKKQVEKTPEASELQGIMGHPSQKDFKGMVSNKSIHDLNITTNDSKCAPKVYGLDLVNVREKMVWKKQIHVDMEKRYVAVQESMFAKLIHITLCTDLFFVNQVPFLVSLSQGQGITTVESMLTCTAKLLT